MESSSSLFPSDVSSLFEMLERIALEHPHNVPYIFLDDLLNESTRLTYKDIVEGDFFFLFFFRAFVFLWLFSLGSMLVSKAFNDQKISAGERALLLFSTCREFVISIFGCFRSGVIAVPVYPPLNSDISRVNAISKDCDASCVLSVSSIATKLKALTWVSRNNARSLSKIVSVDSLIVKNGLTVNVPKGRNEIAMIQYSSGTTGKSKGVIMTHSNLISHLSIIYGALVKASGISTNVKESALSWLPVYHDMGLMGFVFMPSCSPNWTVRLMSPLTFLKNPSNWLNAISKFRASVSGAPNFALDVCASKIKKESLAKDLDLSCLRWVVTGAEMVRHETLKNFNKIYRAYGMREIAITPAYGLAEACLMVSIKLNLDQRVLWIDKYKYQRNQIEIVAEKNSNAIPFVSCGHCVQTVGLKRNNGEMQVLDSKSSILEVSEVFIKGPCVTRGYWNSAKTRGEDQWLSTGDTAFSVNGEIFICGRLKDLMVINGRKFWPHDIGMYKRKHSLI